MIVLIYLVPLLENILIKAGSTNNISNVAMAKPKLIEITMGCKNRACSDVSSNKGTKPTTVVTVVKNTALNL